jgi:hypothetical protein
MFHAPMIPCGCSTRQFEIDIKVSLGSHFLTPQELIFVIKGSVCFYWSILIVEHNV